MRFEFAAPTRIVFGVGTFDALGDVIAELGRRALVVIGSRTLARDGVADRLRRQLAERGVGLSDLTATGEPDIGFVERGARVARADHCDLVVGIGGGSAIDAAKAIAGLATNDGEALDYLEVIGRGQTLGRAALPIVAVPTTAGTGAEVTRNAVIAAPEQRFKASVRSPFLYPRVAVLDPELTLSLSASVTASSGLDALTQLIEAYVSVRANPLTDALALDGIHRAARALPRAHADGHDREARADMLLASLFSGLSLANAGLGVVHGFASPLGGRYPIPHGVACAALLPHVMAVNVAALRAREPEGQGRRRYAEVGRALVPSLPTTVSADVAIDAGVAHVAQLCRDLRVLRLRDYEITAADVPALVEAAAQASSTRGNPIALTTAELTDALTRAV